MKRIITIALIFITVGADAQLQQLKISANKRFFQTADGKPFFWLGDTGWLLFIKCNREEAIKYLDNRKEKGFNVIQAMVVHDLNQGVNAYGDSSLHNKDVSKPNTTAGSSFTNATAYDFWDHVDFVIDEAAKRGIYMALVPIWGGNIKRVSEEQAKVYATFLANRYKNKSNIIWLNGGDIRGSEGLKQWSIIGNTIRSIDKKHLITFHPRGRYSSSEWFHNEPWLDFNMFQSGHKRYDQDTVSTEKLHYGEDNWKYVAYDYQLKPIKPTLDGEPSYEGIPQGLHDSAEIRWKAADVRRYAYWNVFAGGAGYTYGDNAVMQFHRKGNTDNSFGVAENWDDEINAPGAGQMQYVKQLMLSKSYFDRVPDQSLVVDNGEKYERVLATRGKNYVMFYVYNGREFKIDMDKVGFDFCSFFWFNPKNGEKEIFYPENYPDGKMGVRTFNPPGEQTDGNDWVLIINRETLLIR